MKFRYTEQILNSTSWMDGEGTITPVTEMDKEHLHNILNFIYRKRDRYWLNCREVKTIESFKDGDEFFQKVIRRSTLWTVIMDQLNNSVEGFNFDWDRGTRKFIDPELVDN